MTNMEASFWRGFFVHSFLSCMLQDWYGLETYIQLLRIHWVNIYWWVWVPLLMLVAISEMVGRAKAKLGLMPNSRYNIVIKRSL